MRVLLITWLFLSVQRVAFCDGCRYSVNQVSPGMSVEETRQRLGPTCIDRKSFISWVGWETRDLSGFHSPVIHMQHLRGKIVGCIGTTLELHGEKLLQRGDKAAKVRARLGKPYAWNRSVGGPTVQIIYIIHGCQIIVGVSDDAYLRANLPRKDWATYCGKVWRIRLCTLASATALLKND